MEFFKIKGGEVVVGGNITLHAFMIIESSAAVKGAMLRKTDARGQKYGHPTVRLMTSAGDPI